VKKSAPKAKKVKKTHTKKLAQVSSNNTEAQVDAMIDSI
jgi:hypothetical protein